ncbi:MAG: amidohydrolase family protein [Planctomycetota bacterium]|jgi:predicted TIM-barrel fold metal-dependent hydrolase
MEIPTGITDLHVHIQPWQQIKDHARATIEHGREDVPDILRYQSDPAAFAAHLDEQGISRAGLINYVSPKLMGFDASCNDWIAAYRDHDPSRFFAWGGIHPAFCEDVPAEMARLLDELKLDGIKIHPPHQEFAANAYLTGELPELREVYAACEARDVPVMIHTGTSVFEGARSRLGDPLHVDDIAVDFPRLRLVMAHAGRPLWYEAAFFVARRHPRVYVELSGIPPKQLPERLPRLELLGEKVLWGTDWPSPGVRDLRRNIATFCALEAYSEDFKRGVLVDHLEAFWPPR